MLTRLLGRSLGISLIPYTAPLSLVCSKSFRFFTTPQRCSSQQLRVYAHSVSRKHLPQSDGKGARDTSAKPAHHRVLTLSHHHHLRRAPQDRSHRALNLKTAANSERTRRGSFCIDFGDLPKYTTSGRAASAAYDSERDFKFGCYLGTKRAGKRYSGW